MSNTQTPRVLKNFNAFINGVGYAGRVEEVELPEVALKMEEWRGGGMDGSTEIDMGQEVMTSKITMGEYIPDLITALAKGGQRIQFRGALKRDSDGSAVIPVVCELGARFKKFTPGSWKAGDMAKAEHELTVDYFKWTQAGVELMEIDTINMIRRIGGVDQLAEQRAALGL
jgi:P2 family phage contractile tail tube protein